MRTALRDVVSGITGLCGLSPLEVQLQVLAERDARALAMLAAAYGIEHRKLADTASSIMAIMATTCSTFQRTVAAIEQALAAATRGVSTSEAVERLRMTGLRKWADARAAEAAAQMRDDLAQAGIASGPKPKPRSRRHRLSRLSAW